MNVNEKLDLLARTFGLRFLDRDKSQADPATLVRFQQMGQRLSGRTAEDDFCGDVDDCLTAQLGGHQTAEDHEAVRGITHWCGDSGRYHRQEIRCGEMLSGAGQCFEIDPIGKLKDF